MGSITGTGGGNDESLIERLVDEFAARFRRGERPDVEEFVGRYPHLADEIREILPAMARLEGPWIAWRPSGIRARRPTPDLRDFRIVREIGHGGMGSSTRPCRSPWAGPWPSRSSPSGCCATPRSGCGLSARRRRRRGCTIPTSSRSSGLASTTAFLITSCSSSRGPRSMR